MPQFEIQRQSDLETFRTDAPDEEAAVRDFTQMLNTKLTLIDNDVVPEHLMRRITPNTVVFVKFDIPVYSEA